AAFRDEFRALVEGVALHGLVLPRETRIAALGPLVDAQRLEHGEHVDRELAQGEEMEEKLEVGRVFVAFQSRLGPGLRRGGTQALEERGLSRECEIERAR